MKRSILASFCVGLAACGPSLTCLECDPEPVDDPANPTEPEPEVPERVLLTERSCTVVATHSVNASRVEIAGEFNGWTPASMTRGEDGTWTADLGVLDRGEYGFKYLYDGVWIDPPVDVHTKWVGGVENWNLRVGDCTRPLLQLVEAHASADGSLHAEVLVARADGGVPIEAAGVRVTVGDQTVDPVVDVEAGTITVDVDGLAPGKHSVRVWLTDEAGQTAENEPLFTPLWVEEDSFVWDDGLMYFVFTDRFRDGDFDDPFQDPTWNAPTCSNYQGGDFRGVMDALEEGWFEALGVNTLWLSPVYDNPEGGFLGTDGQHDFSGYHGYWPIDGLRVEDRWGDADGSGEERLHQLVQAAHARGIRVMFDLVLNHVHEQHTYVEEHPEWFGDGCVCGDVGCDWEERALDCWFVSYLPDLDYRNHWIVERVLADTLRLVEEFDVDAVRVDAAKHMDHVIMRSLSMRLREDYEAGGGAPFYLVGETFSFDAGSLTPWIGPHELDGQFDFPLYSAIRQAFIHDGSLRDLESSAAANQATYGADALMSPFLGNHDIERFATAVTGAVGDCWTDWRDDPMETGGGINQWDLINRASLAFAYTLTQPGVPLIYYGDEIGLHGGGDPDNRRMMTFDLSENQAELLARVRSIGATRTASVALRRGAKTQLWVDDTMLIYALDAGGGEVGIVALNTGDARVQTVSITGFEADGAVFVDQDGESVTADGSSLEIALDPWQFRLFTRP